MKTLNIKDQWTCQLHANKTPRGTLHCKRVCKLTEGGGLHLQLELDETDGASASFRPLDHRKPWRCTAWLLYMPIQMKIGGNGFLAESAFFPRAAHVHADPKANVKRQVIIYDDPFKVLSSPMTLSRVFLLSFRSKTIWPTMLEHSGCALLLSWATCLPVVLSWIAQTTMISPELALRLCFFIKYLALSLCSFLHPPGFFCAFFFSAAGFFCCCNFFCPYICCSIMASCKPKIAKNSCTQAVSWDTETNSIRVCRRKLIIAECASHLLHCFTTYTCKQLSIGQTVNSCKQTLICHPCVLDKWRLWSDGSLRHRISAMWPRANLRKTAKVFFSRSNLFNLDIVLCQFSCAKFVEPLVFELTLTHDKKRLDHLRPFHPSKEARLPSNHIKWHTTEKHLTFNI